MKKNLILYAVYLLIITLLYCCFSFGYASKDVIFIIYLIFGGITLLICCGSYVYRPTRPDSLDSIQAMQNTRNYAIYFKPLLLIGLPLLIAMTCLIKS